MASDDPDDVMDPPGLLTQYIPASADQLRDSTIREEILRLRKACERDGHRPAEQADGTWLCVRCVGRFEGPAPT